jgi:hypothetical protein
VIMVRGVPFAILSKSTGRVTFLRSDMGDSFVYGWCWMLDVK